MVFDDMIHPRNMNSLFMAAENRGHVLSDNDDDFIRHIRDGHGFSRGQAEIEIPGRIHRRGYQKEDIKFQAAADKGRHIVPGAGSIDADPPFFGQLPGKPQHESAVPFKHLAFRIGVADPVPGRIDVGADRDVLKFRLSFGQVFVDHGCNIRRAAEMDAVSGFHHSGGLLRRDQPGVIFLFEYTDFPMNRFSGNIIWLICMFSQIIEYPWPRPTHMVVRP